MDSSNVQIFPENSEIQILLDSGIINIFVIYLGFWLLKFWPSYMQISVYDSEQNKNHVSLILCSGKLTSLHEPLAW